MYILQQTNLFYILEHVVNDLGLVQSKIDIVILITCLAHQPHHDDPGQMHNDVLRFPINYDPG